MRYLAFTIALLLLAPLAHAQAPAAAAAPAALPAGTRLLVIGDSMAHALFFGLKRAAAEAGFKVAVEGKQSTYIDYWAWTQDIPGILATYRPDVVIIALGANEVRVGSPEKRAKGVRRLVERVGDIPCVWVTPPLPATGQTGIFDVIERNRGGCDFFETNRDAPPISRRRDGQHPDAPGQNVWADALLQWLSARPLLAESPRRH